MLLKNCLLLLNVLDEFSGKKCLIWKV